MSKAVLLSKKSQELIERYLALGCSPKSALPSSPVDADVLVAWLSHEAALSTHNSKEQKEHDFILASLRGELLRDLLISMDIKQDDTRFDDPQPTNATRLKFYLLVVSGTVLAACEGFDSISSVLSVLAIPQMITLFAALAFSVLSVVVFYGFDLVQVSKNIGVKLSDAPKLLDLYLLQMNDIKSLRKKINTYQLSALSKEELEHLTQVLTMLQIRFDSLVESSKQFAIALDSPKMNLTKNICVGIAGLMFLGGGFCSGQSVALFMLGLVMPSVTATFLPVVLFSVAVGLAAFSLYWYVEKVGLQQLISGWFGLDEEKIEILCNAEELDKQAKKLSNLKEKIIGTAELKQRYEGKGIKKEADAASVTEYKENSNNNIYSFYPAANTKSLEPETTILKYDAVAKYP